MKTTISQGSKTLPKITFDPDQCELRIEGWSFSEKPQTIFDPVLKLIDEFISETNKGISMHVSLQCFNTASGKCLMNIAQVIGNQQGNNTIYWHFDAEDEETREWGEDISHATGIPFQFVSLSSSN
ncbi:MAG: DUF1987 domain-containing protein [Cryomorphaceae bacterium]|nr:DUF1987 domain-containing protein [Cryomorphaceae bacterium]